MQSYLLVTFQYGVVHFYYVVVNCCWVLCNFTKACRRERLLLRISTTCLQRCVHFMPNKAVMSHLMGQVSAAWEGSEEGCYC